MTIRKKHLSRVTGSRIQPARVETAVESSESSESMHTQATLLCNTPGDAPFVVHRAEPPHACNLLLGQFSVHLFLRLQNVLKGLNEPILQGIRVVGAVARKVANKLLGRVTSAWGKHAVPVLFVVNALLTKEYCDHKRDLRVKHNIPSR